MLHSLLIIDGLEKFIEIDFFSPLRFIIEY